MGMAGKITPNRAEISGMIGGWLGVCFAAASFGAIFSPGSWYAQLNKPAWNPPSWLFGPVWSALYIMMAIAAWLVWRRGGFAGQRIPLTAFLAQLLANALWSWLFFGLHQPVLGLLDIVLLWGLLVWTIGAFGPPRASAGVLLLPCLGWISFAYRLNLALWR